LDSITKARYHKQLSTLVKGANAPLAADEEADPRAADAIYTAWSHFLRANVRDNPNIAPLLLKENINYGYRRNVWGMRPMGIILCAACVITTGGRLWFIYKGTNQISEHLVGAFIVSFFFLGLWVFRFTDEWVRVPADAYAERLAESLETFGSKTAAAKDSGKK